MACTAYARLIGITDLVFLLEKDHELRYRRFRDLDDQTTEHRTASDHSVILVQFVKAFAVLIYYYSCKYVRLPANRLLTIRLLLLLLL